MPLLPNILYNGLINMDDNAKSPGDTIGKAVVDYMNGIIPPTTTLQVAGNTFISTLNSVTHLTPLPPILATALDLYMANLGLGMAPTFVAVPPLGSISWVTPIFSIPQPKQVFASSFSSAMQAWVITGTATNPVSGVVVPWS